MTAPDPTWPVMLELRQVTLGVDRVTIPRPDVQREAVRLDLVDRAGALTPAGTRALDNYEVARETERRRRRAWWADWAAARTEGRAP